MLLESNFPNPFNPETIIRFGLPEDGNASIKIYSITGEEVTTLRERYMLRGYHEVKWDGRNKAGNQVASGMYFSVLRSGEQMLVRKMMLLR